MNGKLKTILRRISEAAGAIGAGVSFVIAHIWLFVVIAAIMAAILVLSFVMDSCNSRSARKAGEAANKAANNAAILKTERDRLHYEAELDLQNLERQKNELNENINATLRDVRRPRALPNGVTGAELDRQADDYIRHSANANDYKQR